jgi:hypothetical protein
VFPAAPRLSGGRGGGAELTNPFVILLTIGGFCPGLSLTGGASGAELPPGLDDPAPGRAGPGLPADDDPLVLLAGGGGGAPAPPRL